MRIRILFDYGAHDSCFWNDEPTDRENYGSHIDVDDLPLSNSTKCTIKALCAEYQTSLNWAYPPDPSPWTTEQAETFIQRAKECVAHIFHELGDAFTLIDQTDRLVQSLHREPESPK